MAYFKSTTGYKTVSEKLGQSNLQIVDLVTNEIETGMVELARFKGWTGFETPLYSDYVLEAKEKCTNFVDTTGLGDCKYVSVNQSGKYYLYNSRSELYGRPTGTCDKEYYNQTDYKTFEKL